jgi:hypothetical protein
MKRLSSTPLIAYHGADRFHETLRPSRRGSFGSGLYMADENAAANYATSSDTGTVIRLEVRLATPYHYRASFDHDLDFDSAAVGLVRALMPADVAQALLQESMQGDGMFGVEIENALRELGHDGVIVTYDDGSQEIIAFEPHSQVRHALAAANEPAPLPEPFLASEPC